MATPTLESPMLTGLRSQARELVDAAEIPADLSESDVVLDGHRTLAATPSFADEIVKILLVERHARSLTVRVAGREFTQWLENAANVHQVKDRLITSSEM